jgi:putative hemolysin
LVRSSNLVLGLFRDSTNFVESKLSREDLIAMVREAADQSDLSSSSRDMFRRAAEFPTLRVADVMVHRRDVVAIAADASPEALRQAIVERGHRRMPVYEGSLDHVIGYVLRDDVIPRLWDGKPIVLRELLRPARFVPENMPADRALRDLQARRAHLVIVADEHGGVAGIVTMEDLVEELVGEIFSENDVGVTETAKRQADGSWLVQGNLGIREFARLADLDLEGPDSVRSMGGLIVHLAGGMLPGQGDRFRWEGNVELEAVEVTARRVRLVRVRLV